MNLSDEPFEETEASLADIQHEYEPLKPNDYDQVLELRKKQEELGYSKLILNAISLFIIVTSKIISRMFLYQYIIT